MLSCEPTHQTISSTMLLFCSYHVQLVLMFKTLRPLLFSSNLCPPQGVKLSTFSQNLTSNDFKRPFKYHNYNKVLVLTKVNPYTTYKVNPLCTFGVILLTSVHKHMHTITPTDTRKHMPSPSHLFLFPSERNQRW